MHLPVAPRCNISCNYCNRKFDCVNESRPGVTSEVLTPDTAKQKFDWVKEKLDNLSVVGIAGPGDALANWENTKRTIELIKACDQEIIFCLSTNGLMLPEYAPELVGLGVKHVTVTVNCLEAEIGAKIYRYVNYEGKRYEGVDAAAMLIGSQLTGIEYLARHGVLVKVNIVMIPGVNDHHIPAVVKKVKELGAFITNIMPLIPAPGSVFETFPQTSMKAVNDMRNLCQVDIQQMRHCKQCRADAIGLLGEDRSQEFRLCDHECGSPAATTGQPKKYKIAVTSKYGKLVDLHFGHAAEFLIYEGEGRAFELVERRRTPKYCLGIDDCDGDRRQKDAVLDILGDCDAVLTMRIGYNAQKNLLAKGIMSVEDCYTVEGGLEHAYEKLTLNQA
jgi:nitrogen fixation protein NifB